MINLDQVTNIEFPSDLINRCKASTNQIIRLPNKTGRNIAEVKQTLLEQTELQCKTFSDIFEITEFVYDDKTQKGHIRADISLCQPTNHIEIDAEIVDLDNNNVVGRVSTVQKEQSSTLEMQEDFTLGNGISKNLGIIAYGKWGNVNPNENELAIFSEINHLDSQVGYDHVRPKKEEKAEIIGTLEKIAPSPVEKGDADHIVIALIRAPENTEDVDYICGFGRDSKGHPNLCVPGQGTIHLPTGEKAASDDQHKNTAVCRLYRKTGGAMTIATTEAYSTNKIDIQAHDNAYNYSFVSWNVGYDDPAEWKKTEFEYRFDITLHSTYQGKWKRYDLYIDSRQTQGSLTDQVKTLQIMYGCLAPDTKILMFDSACNDNTQKKEVPICQVKIGDIVVGKDDTPIKVRNIWSGEEADSMIELWTAELTEPLLMTRNHPVIVQNHSGKTVWKRASQCSLSDKVLLSDNKTWTSITQLNSKDPCDLVYNLELEPQDGCPNAMFCNGVLTGDQLMQNGEFGNGDN